MLSLASLLQEQGQGDEEDSGPATREIGAMSLLAPRKETSVILQTGNCGNEL